MTIGATDQGHEIGMSENASTVDRGSGRYKIEIETETETEIVIETGIVAETERKMAMVDVSATRVEAGTGIGTQKVGTLRLNVFLMEISLTFQQITLLLALNGHGAIPGHVPQSATALPLQRAYAHLLEVLDLEGSIHHIEIRKKKRRKTWLVRNPPKETPISCEQTLS